MIISFSFNQIKKKKKESLFSKPVNFDDLKPEPNSKALTAGIAKIESAI